MDKDHSPFLFKKNPDIPYQTTPKFAEYYPPHQPKQGSDLPEAPKEFLNHKSVA